MMDVKSHMKRVRAFRAKRKFEWESMDEKKKKKILENRAKPVPIKKQLTTLLWDYNHNQLNSGKKKLFQDLVKKRINELENGDEELFKNENKTYIKIRGDFENV